MSDGLDKLIKNAKKLDGEHEITMNELYPTTFMSNCSQYRSFDEMVEASGFKVETQTDFEAIPSKEWDDFISENTSFSSWEEMQQEAVAFYAQSKLFKGL